MAVTGKSSLDCPVILFFAFLLLSPTTVFSEGNTESPAGSAPTAFQCRGHIEAAIKDFVTRQQYPQSSVPEKVVAQAVDSGPPPVESEEDDEVTEIPETPTKESEEEDATEGEEEEGSDEAAAPEETEGVEDDDDQEKTEADEGTEEEEDEDEDTEGGEGETEPEVAEAESAEDEEGDEEEEGEASKAEDEDDDDEGASKAEDDEDDDEEASKAEDEETEASKVEDKDEDGEASKAEDEDEDEDDDEEGEASKVEDEDEDEEEGEASKDEDEDEEEAEASKEDDEDEDEEEGEASKAEDEDDEEEETKKVSEEEELTKAEAEEDEDESAEATKDEEDDEDDDEQTEKAEGSEEDEDEEDQVKDEEESEEAKQADDDEEDDEEEGTEEQKSAEAAASEEEDDKDGDEATGEDEESGEASQEEAVGSAEQPESAGEGDGDGDASQEETEQAGEHDSGEGDADGTDEGESLADESQAEEPEEGSEETSVAARPEDSRSHEMIEKILGLDEVSMAATIATEKFVLTTLKELKHMYESSIKPMEVLYKFNEISNRFVGDAELFSKPMILFIGPWSSGKSTMINYLLDIEDTRAALTTGAEPQSNGFTVLTYGDNEQILDGMEVAADWTFSSLQKFGESFLGRLQGKKLPSHLLRKVTIIDTPGILENRKQQERSYPFNDACQWFIDRADIIYVIFDPTKLDMGLEIEALFDQLKGRETQVRIILNKADSIKPQELMRVQSTLLWNLSPLLGCSEPPTIFVGTFWSKPYLPGSPETLFEAQEAALLNDLRMVTDGRVENRISFMRRHAVRVRNHAKMVDCYLNTYYNHKSFFANKKKVADEIIDNPQNYHIYEGLSTLTNVSRYDLPDPDIYRDFFRLNPLYDFKLLASTCSFFKGCPLDRLDLVIAYDLPELMGKYRKQILAVTQDGTGEKR